MRNGLRMAIALVVIGLIAGGLLLDDGRPDRVEVAFGDAPRFVMPVAAPPTALSSTWFCPGVRATGDGAVDAVVTVENAGERDASGTVTVHTAEGDSASQDIDVPARSRRGIRLTDVRKAEWLAALVEMDAGDIAVELTITGDRGRSDTACASAASDRWYLANGATTRDAGEVLTLFNPFPDTAVVDLAFTTEQGRFTAPRLLGLPVPAGSVVPIDLTNHVRRRVRVSTALTARTGRVVLGRIQTFDGSETPEGISISLGAPAASDTWYFPDGRTTAAIFEAFHVFNPTDRQAAVSVDVLLDDKKFVAPFKLTLPPFSSEVVNASDPKRVPRSVGHASVVRSENGVPIVAERVVAAGEEATRHGYSSMIGSPLAAKRWVFPAGETTDATDEWIVAFNPSTQPLRLSVSAVTVGRVTPIAELQDIPVEGGRRAQLRLGKHIERPDLPVLVEATAPVVVERDLYAAEGLGLSTAVGVPLSS